MNSFSVAIENLYKAFSDVPAPRSISFCLHCYDEHEFDVLLSTDLRALTPDDLSEYASSALLTAGDVHDYLYFLPRILEISASDNWWWPDIEITGRAIRDTDLSTWPASRTRALTEFFDAAIKHLIETEEYEQIDDWMCCIARAGLDVHPFLDVIELDRRAVFHYVNVNAVSVLKGKLANQFWGVRDDGYNAILEWLRSEKVASIYAEAAKSEW